jgi:hypothetical protein
MIKPFSNRLFTVALLVLELSALWAFLWAYWETTSSSTLLIGSIAVYFMLIAHLIAISIQFLIPKFPTHKHTYALILAILEAILLAVLLAYGMLSLVVYGHAAQIPNTTLAP